MSPMISLILDLVIVGLLAATIAYAIILNKQIVKLRESRGEMAELIQGLNDAMAKADTGVRGLKKTAADTGEDLQRTVAKAQALRDELHFMIEAADTLATRLGNVAERDVGRDSGRPGAARGPMARTPVKPALAPRPLARPVHLDMHDDDHDDAPPPVRLDPAPRRVVAQDLREPPAARDSLARDRLSPSRVIGSRAIGSRAERELLQAIENAGRGIG